MSTFSLQNLTKVNTYSKVRNPRDFANIFLSTNKIDSFLFKIRLILPPQTKYNSKYQFLNCLAGKLKTEYASITEAFRYPFDDKDYIAIPEDDFKGGDYEIWVDNRSYRLIPTSKSVTLNPKEYSDFKAIKDIISGNVRKKLRESNEFWESVYRNTFYNIEPILEKDGVEVYRGFEFRSEIFGNKLALVIDLTTCFLDSLVASDYLSNENGKVIYESKMKRYVGKNATQASLYVDYGATKVSGTFHSIDPANISEKLITLRGKNISVYGFLQEKYPEVLDYVPKDDICVNLQFGKKIYPCAGSLIRRSLTTEELAEINPKLSDLSRISPEKRVEQIGKYADTINPITINKKAIFYRTDFADKKDFEISRVSYPMLQFKDGHVISCKGEKPGDPKYHYVPMSKWVKAKQKGLLDFGPYEQGGLDRVYFLIPEHDKVDKNVAQTFVNDFTDKLRKVQNFQVRDVLNYKQPEAILRSLQEKHPEFFVIALLPPQDDTFYAKFKECARNPVQCVRYETINVNPKDFSRKDDFDKALGVRQRSLFVLASKIIAKSSGLPWILGENLYYDLTIGIDVGHDHDGKMSNCASIFYFYGKKGEHYGILPPISIKREDIGEENAYRIFIEIVNNVHELTELNAIAFHWDGFITIDAKKGLKRAYNELLSKGLLNPSTEVVVVNISESNHPYRLFERKYDNQIVNPAAGKYLVLDRFSCVLVTTGFPFITGNRTSDPIILKAESISGYFDIHHVVRDTFFYTELNWNSPFSTVKLPVTIRHPDTMARQFLKYRIQEYYPG